jgi:hypothetical protein
MIVGMFARRMEDAHQQGQQFPEQQQCRGQAQ